MTLAAVGAAAVRRRRRPRHLPRRHARAVAAGRDRDRASPSSRRRSPRWPASRPHEAGWPRGSSTPRGCSAARSGWRSWPRSRPRGPTPTCTAGATRRTPRCPAASSWPSWSRRRSPSSVRWWRCSGSRGCAARTTAPAAAGSSRPARPQRAATRRQSRPVARCFVTRELPGTALERLRERHEVEVWPERLPPSDDELRHARRRGRGAARAAHRPVDAELIDGARDLRAIANYAVGYDNIDLAAAARTRDPRRQHPRRAHRRDRRPGLRAAARRRAPTAARRRRRRATGDWVTWEPAGHLGARRLRRDARDRRHGPDRPGRRPARRGLRDADRPHRLETAGVGSTSCSSGGLRLAPLPADPRDPPPDRRRRAGADEAHGDPRSTPPAAPIIDQAALVDALHRGTIAGAALDVTDPEPLARRGPAARRRPT